MPTNERAGAGGNGGSQGLMHSIQQQATTALSSQKDRAADGMKAVIDAVRQTGESLRENNGTIAQYIDTAAGQLERWSQQVRERDVSELMDEVGALARRRPALFIGTGVAIGVVAARFLKSSAPDRAASGGSYSSTSDFSGGRSDAMGQTRQRFATSDSSIPYGSGSPTYGSPASGSLGASGSTGMSGTASAGTARSSIGSTDAADTDTMGTTTDSTAGVAADRSSSRTRTRSRARSTDER